MLQLIQQSISAPDLSLRTVLVFCERLQLAKRRWRAVAEDGEEFGIEVERPLRHGDTVWQGGGKRYVIEQLSERLLEVNLDMPPSAAAGIGWAVGNLHLELMSEAHRLLTPDEPATRQLFERIGVSYTAIEDRFRAGRFFRGQTAVSHELGSSHKH